MLTNFLRGSCILAVIALGACADRGSPESRIVTVQAPTTTADALAAARTQWAAAHITSYDVTVTPSCFCDVNSVSSVVVSVRNGVVTARTYARDGSPVSAAYTSLFPDIDGLFSKLNDAIQGGAASVSATYHPTNGYPTSIYIDYIKNAADDELGLTITAFVIR